MAQKCTRAIYDIGTIPIPGEENLNHPEFTDPLERPYLNWPEPNKAAFGGQKVSLAAYENGTSSDRG